MHAATTTGDCMHNVSWALVVKGLKADSVRNLRYKFLYNFCENLLSLFAVQTHTRCLDLYSLTLVFIENGAVAIFLTKMRIHNKCHVGCIFCQLEKKQNTEGTAVLTRLKCWCAVINTQIC